MNLRHGCKLNGISPRNASSWFTHICSAVAIRDDENIRSRASNGKHLTIERTGENVDLGLVKLLGNETGLEASPRPKTAWAPQSWLGTT